MQPVEIQEQIAQAKINRFGQQEESELGEFRRSEMTPEEHLQEWRDFKEGAVDFAKGLPANAVGLGVDFMGMMVAGAYNGYNYLVHDTRGFTMPDFKDIPGSSASIGAAFGADVESIGFLTSGLANPEGAVLGAVKALMVMAKGGKALGIAAGASKAVIGGLMAARMVPGELGRMAKATRMLAKGESEAAIFTKTGWWKDADGWKFYINDAGASVNMERIAQQGEKIGAKIGDEFEVSGKLGDFLTHKKYYEAYPEYADMPTNLWVRRIEDNAKGIAQFEVYNSRAAKLGISGQITDSAGGTIRELDIFNSATGRWDNALSVMLHEANHLPQIKEGFDVGANVPKFLERIENAAASSVGTQVAKDLTSGALHEGLTPLQRAAYARDLAGVNETAKASAIYKKINEMIARQFTDAELVTLSGNLAATHTRNVRDVRIMMEELGDILPGKQLDEIVAQIQKWTPKDQFNLAFRRYQNQGGEIGSRITEALMDQTPIEIRAAGAPSMESSIAARVMARGDPVLGDRARQAVDLDDITIPGPADIVELPDL